jgi:large repetitive protein
MIRVRLFAAVPSPALLLASTAVSVAAACGPEGNVSVREVAPALSAPAQVSEVSAQVAHRDLSRKVPSFVWLSGSANYASAELSASAALTSVAKVYQLQPEALGAVSAPIVHDTGKGGIVARVTQRVGHREVFRSEASVMMTRAFAPIAFSGALAPSLHGSDRAPALSTRAAIASAHRAMTGGTPKILTAREAGDATDDYLHFDSASYERPARIKEVLFPTADGVEPAYRIELFLKDAPAALKSSAHAYVVSGLDGRILFKSDLMRFEQATYRAWADPVTLVPMDGPQGNGFAPFASGRPDGTRIATAAAPLVTLANYPFSKNDPWLPDGATTLSGNNVRSYADKQAPNGFAASTLDVEGLATAPRVFDWPANLTLAPTSSPENIRAAVTQQFYIVNFMHEWLYDAGFDEKSKNPQLGNFGRGGRQGDPINIEAQDYSGRNNANAATPADGGSPRIQMYIFSGTASASFTVGAPAGIAGSKPVGTSGGFGSDVFDVSGAVVLGNDGAGADPNDACEALGGNVAGQIVLVHRGTCSFAEKAKNLQNAGAKAMVLSNVASSANPSQPPFMGGSAPDITLPCASLALADGQALEAAAMAGEANIQMKRELGAELDGALDTAVVSHEWGHVLSNRLIGNGDGLTTNQAGGLGEGWSDFVALLLMARADDLSVPSNSNWGGVYPAGSYAMAGSPSDAYFGIRRMPYSVDFTKNGLTLKHISEGVNLPNIPVSYGEDGNGNSEVHATGEVWASMLWECYVALLRDQRFTFQEAQDRMKRYLVSGMKLTPVEPTLLEARDALLAAALASDEQDYTLFWQAFARRGAGVGAVGPSKTSGDNSGVIESFSASDALEIMSAVLKDGTLVCDKDGILDEGEIGTVEITVRNTGVRTLAAPSVELAAGAGDLGSGVIFDDAAPVALGALKPFASGKASLKLHLGRDGALALSSKPYSVDVVARDPALGKAVTRTIAGQRNVDESADSSIIDAVDTEQTSWTVTRNDVSKTSEKWTRVKEGTTRYWTVPNANEPADHRLTSKVFAVTGNEFGLSLRHRYAFESSEQRKKDFDGGVVEVSTDSGKTWKDASTYGTVDYNVTLDNDPNGRNPLKGRKAFGRRSAGYPSWITTSIRVVLGAPSDTVQVRFRAGSDDNAVDKSWDVDDIALSDVASKPFWSLVSHADKCDEAGPRVNAGADQTVKEKQAVVLMGTGTHPKDLPLIYVWTQESGPKVEVTAKGAELRFTAPKLETSGATVIGFALRANDGALVSPAARVQVKVEPGGTEPKGNPGELPPSDGVGGPESPTAKAAGATTVEGGGCSVHSKAPQESSAALGLLVAAHVLYRRRRK